MRRPLPSASLVSSPSTGRSRQCLASIRTALEGPEGAAIFGGNALPEGGRPIAQAYAGHQFGHFTALGDGRAILLGEQITPTGDRFDIQLKGAGPTRFSRRGDGRAALGPMLREYIISEAMHALGIPTTRSLAVVATGEPVYRETVLEGAVLTRVAASHIRVGTMQWAAAHDDVRGDAGACGLHAARGTTRSSPIRRSRTSRCFDAIVDRQASLIARWQLVGFIHGVMNTDNMALSGETIDYGPCAFMDTYDPATVFSSIDQAADTRTATSRRSRSGTWRDLPKRCCRCSIGTSIERWSGPRPRSTAFPASSSSTGWTACGRSLGCSRAKTTTRRSSTTCSPGCSVRSADFTNTFRR